VKILYICTHNRCRSILSEAITNNLANGRIEAFSAGSQPAGEVHPLSLKYLSERGVDTTSLRSQSWDEFSDEHPDIVITVCDSAANEACPVWFGNTVKLHWPLADPSKLEGSEETLRQAFFTTMGIIETRINALLALNFETLSPNELKKHLHQLIKD